MFGSVRTRLTLGVVALIAVVLAAGSVWFVRTVESNLVGRIHAADAEALQALRTDVERDGRVPPRLGQAPGRPSTGVQAIGPDGSVIAANPDADGRAPFLRNDSRRAGAAAASRRGDLALTALTVSTPDGPVSLVAASSLDSVHSSVDELTRLLWFTMPALVLLVGLGTWLVTGRALRPVEALTRQVDDITATNLHERVPVPASGDEVAHLARTMNSMLERLDMAAIRQRQFVSDASHELRSPIAAIRTELEVALLHPESSSWDAVARNALAEDERLEALVADLLALARSDEGRGDDRPLAVDVAEIVWVEAARARRVPVEVTGAPSVVVAGRADDLRRVFVHLVDNAARHAASRVVVTVGEPSPVAPVTVGITVDDDGPGVPALEREHIFERFVRLDEDRSRTSAGPAHGNAGADWSGGSVGGSGLGLAVVRALVERHGGTVSCAESPSGGARFTLTLPIPTPIPTPASP
jgi:signal transduction histidine kinase